MSPSGKAQSNSEAGAGGSLASPHLDPEEKPHSLPLRLSVARGGLGLELSTPVSTGPLVVDELEVELPGLSYPLDLSKGVKQFRNRRSILRHVALRLDAARLSEKWANALTDQWGQGVRVRLHPVYEPMEAERGAPERNNDATNGVPSLAVTIHEGRRALSFDLVVLSGSSPRLAVDSARVVGRDEPPLFLALQALDAGLFAARGASTGTGLNLRRNGRAISMNGLAEAVALMVLPGLGCRLPQVTEQVIVAVEYRKAEFSIVLGYRGEPFSAGRRALWVGAATDFLLKADEFVGGGELGAAREAYLEALQGAPGHSEALLTLAELDLAAGDRAEAALSFLEELDGAAKARSSWLSLARQKLSLSKALGATGRSQLLEEVTSSALEHEGDPVLQALLGLELAELEPELERKRRRLDMAVARAPFLEDVRWARLEAAMAGSDFRTAASDAEHLEAARTSSSGRAAVCLRVGLRFREAGRGDDSYRFLRRALRLEPDDPVVMLRYAECLVERQESVRAAELLQSSVRRLTGDELPGALSASVRGAPDAPNPEGGDLVREILSEARFLLGRLLIQENIDEVSALVHLSAVETRSKVGARARLMEAELRHARGEYAKRERALFRLLEAIEMRWLDAEAVAAQLSDLLGKWRETLDVALVESAERIVGIAVSKDR